MLWGALGGDLELRRASDGSRRLRGRFPYGKAAVLSDGGRTGRPRKEVIAPRAFSYRVDKPDEDIHLLLGHSYDAPLASKSTGTLAFMDTPEALIFDATITRAVAETTHGSNALALIEAGLAIGISPGFRIPPERAVPEAEKTSQEPDDGSTDGEGNPQHGAIIRTILAALLYELSVVVRPAYPEAQVEARNWKPEPQARVFLPSRYLQRWRP